MDDINTHQCEKNATPSINGDTTRIVCSRSVFESLDWCFDVLSHETCDLIGFFQGTEKCSRSFQACRRCRRVQIPDIWTAYRIRLATVEPGIKPATLHAVEGGSPIMESNLDLNSIGIEFLNSSRMAIKNNCLNTPQQRWCADLLLA